MKAAIIGTAGIPARYGGFETLVDNLVTRKQNEEIHYTVYCSSRLYDKKLDQYHGARLVYVPFNANGWQAVLYDTWAFLHAIFTADIVFSMSGNLLFLPLAKLLTRKKVIINIDGHDSKRQKWSTFIQLLMVFFHRINVRYADTLISDNEIIGQDLKAYYGRDSLLIEYGGDNAQPVYNDEKLASKYGLAPKTYSLKVARVEPENNVEMVLEAFRRMPDEKFVFVGNWDKNEFGRKMRSVYGSCPNIVLLNPVYESEEIDLIRTNCKLYIHGHSVGGTNPSLVEAMNLGLPIFAYDVSYNRSTTESEALYFDSIETLADLVRSTDSARLAGIAEKMKEIARRRYTWAIICKKYERLCF